MIWAGVFILLLGGFLFLNAKAPTGVIEWLQSYFATLGGGSFPAPVSGSQVSSIGLRGAQPAVLTDTSLFFWNQSGKEIYCRQHGYSNPVLAVSESRLLVFGRGDTTFRIENPDRTLLTGNTENAIVSGTIAENGSFGLVTESNGYASQLELYSKSGQIRYRWYSSEKKLSTMDLNSTGDAAAVIGMDAVSGNLQSRLYVLDTSNANEQPIFEEAFSDCLVFSASFKTRDELTLLADNQLISCHLGNGRTESFSFGRDVLKAFDDSSPSGTVLCLSVNNDTLDNRIVSFDSQGRKIDEFSVDEKVVSVAQSRRNVYVLTDKLLYLYNAAGKLLKQWELDGEGLMVRAAGNTAYVMFADGINQYKN